MSLIIFLAGILCLFYTDHVHKALPFLLGSIMIFTGVVALIDGIRTQEYRTPKTKLTATGMVALITGLTVIGCHSNSDSLIGATWGIVGLIKGAELLNEAFYAISCHGKWLRNLLRSGIQIFLSILLLLDPVENVPHHIFILGLELIAIGAELFIEWCTSS